MGLLRISPFFTSKKDKDSLFRLHTNTCLSPPVLGEPAVCSTEPGQVTHVMALSLNPVRHRFSAAAVVVQRALLSSMAIYSLFYSD